MAQQISIRHYVCTEKASVLLDNVLLPELLSLSLPQEKNKFHMKPNLANNKVFNYVRSLHEKHWKEGMFFAAGMSIVFFFPPLKSTSDSDWTK